MGWFKSNPRKYIAKKAGCHYSPRYKKTISWPKGYPTDGATMAKDLDIEASRTHDRMCEVGKWDDGTPITNWQASNVYSDILRKKGFWQWFDRKWATFLFGGKNLKKF